MASRRTVLLPLVCALVAACGSGADEGKGRGSGSAASAESADGEDRIACAPGGAEKFTNDCVVERSQDQGKLFLTVRHPDGGFRRFEVMTDGTGLATADGAQDAKVAVADGLLDVSVGADRYKFPATVKAGEGAEAKTEAGAGAKGDAAASR